jgi:FkbM family methyltransferase
MLYQIAHKAQNALLGSYRRVAWGLLSRRESVTIPTSHGLMTISTKDQFISKSLFMRRQYGMEVMVTAIELMRRNQKLKESGSACLIDIGANIGTVCIKLMREGLFDCALAFEPDPLNCRYLRRNIEQNELSSKIRALEVGLSSKNGEMCFERSSENFGDHRIRVAAGVASRDAFHESEREITTVRVRKLDDMVASEGVARSQVALLWMDTQGHEVHVLRGATGLLENGVSVVMEFWPYGLERSGTSKESFCELVTKYFTHFYDLREQQPTRNNIMSVPELFRRYTDLRFTDLLLLQLPGDALPAPA